MNEVCYERLRPAQVVEARKKFALAYLPLGTVEWHGRHNPLGLDALKAHALCVLAARQGGGLVFPSLWYGEHREIQLMEANEAPRDDIAAIMQLPASNFHRPYMGGRTVSDQAHFYLQLLSHIFHQIHSLGFRAIFVLCGHYPLGPYARFAGDVFHRETGTPVLAVGEHELVSDVDLGGQIGDHAGRWETSLLMHLEPGLTDLSALPQDRSKQLVGVIGDDPRDASEAFGAKAVEAVVQRMVEQGGSLLEDRS